MEGEGGNEMADDIAMEIEQILVAAWGNFFDDYYWFTNEKTAKGIENELRKIKEDEKIEVLFYSSKAKLEKYQYK